MIFHSLVFLVFLAVVLAGYWALPRRGQNVLLVGASYVFYGWEHPWFLLPLWASTLVDYGCALGIERFPARRRAFLLASVGTSVGLLATFKYAGFAQENIGAVLARFGAQPWRTAVQVALPAGLSFYTFQSIGYIVDVYAGRVRAERRLADYALYVSFFPQLVAGPIERAGHMLPQYRATRRFDPDAWRGALLLMLWGFFKKLVIADNLAVVVGKVFALQAPSFPVVWAGTFAFAWQIYADFSGYTDIARGTARLLGIDLVRNFDHPYRASSPADFWRRWHLSLSRWLRDFIYIPLGGSRCGPARASFNLLATFTISGLWHGASWNYVLWGVYWGLLILAQRLLAFLGVTRRLPLILKIALTFAATCAGWLLFRERNLAQLARDLAQSPFAAGAAQWRIGAYLAVLALFYALPLVLQTALANAARSRWNPVARLPEDGRFALEVSLGTLLLLGIVAARSVTTADFIYFQF